VIPPQKAGRIAEIAGAADHTGWCPIDAATFASRLVPNVHVIGDACIAGGIPKSASAANAEAHACAAVIVDQLSGKSSAVPQLSGACYNTVAPGYGFSLSGIYQPKDGQFAEVDRDVTSPVDAPREVRQREADMAKDWFKAITVDAFG
jgi:sulfide dehydrogenase [flavocytochrome c] flavoprotein subunit